VIKVTFAAALCCDVVVAVAVVLEVELVHPIAILFDFFLPVLYSDVAKCGRGGQASYRAPVECCFDGQHAVHEHT
jgi:hypothetical protein